MTIVKQLCAWLAKVFKSTKTDGAKIAIAITEGLQTELKLGVLPTIADIVASILPRMHDLPRAAIAELEKAVPAILATELAIEGLPRNPREKDLLEFENRLMTAFKVQNDNSRMWTMIASQIYAIIKRQVGQPSIPFSRLVGDVEKAYQDFITDQAEVLTEKFAISALPIVAG